MRLELTRHNCHYPLKVARLPIPPFLQNQVPRTGLEPACLSTHAPETCASTIPPPGQLRPSDLLAQTICHWAENETRTRDPNLGKVVLYQLSYFRSTLAIHWKHLFPNCECKGSVFSETSKTYPHFFENMCDFFSQKASEAVITALFSTFGHDNPRTGTCGTPPACRRHAAWRWKDGGYR